jgi:hypothetical protein
MLWALAQELGASDYSPERKRGIHMYVYSRFLIKPLLRIEHFLAQPWNRGFLYYAAIKNRAFPSPGLESSFSY